MKYVKTYLRSYTTFDGKVVKDEESDFTEVQSRSHHSMYFDPDKGYRVADAETLVAHWTFMGLPHGQSYRLRSHDELVRAAERDYETALNRLRALGCEPNVYSAGECGRCGSTPDHRDLTCPACTNLDGTPKF